MIVFLRGLLGLTFILAFAVALSADRRRINWKTVGMGLAIQLAFAFFILKGPELAETFAPFGWPADFFSWVSSFFVVVLGYMEEGARFVFGDLALSPGRENSLGFFFFAQVLPTIVFFASLMSVLYYMGVMQYIVRGMAWLVSRLLGTSGPESLSVTANVFVGQTEAPLVIKPFIQNMSRSELMAVMTGGMATIAGGVMASYVQLLGDRYAQTAGVALDVGRQMFAEQLLGASLMAAPAALVLAKILIPETEKDVKPLSFRETKEEEVAEETTADPAAADIHPSAGSGQVAEEEGTGPRNVIDAAASGAAVGLKLAMNVGAMLIAFIALIAMMNGILGWAGGLFGLELTLEMLFGWVLAPVAWLIGVPPGDLMDFGTLLGTKVVVNEFVAYLGLADAVAAGTLSPKTIAMATFALCGFANFSSIAIQIGGIGPLAPSRTGEIAQLGLLAVLAGTLANLMTATIAGVLLS